MRLALRQNKKNLFDVFSDWQRLNRSMEIVHNNKLQLQFHLFLCCNCYCTERLLMTVKCPSFIRSLFNEVAREEDRIRGGTVFANTYLYWWPFNRRSFPIEFNLYPTQVGLAINKMAKRRQRGHSEGMCLALFLILVLMGHLMEITQFSARLLLRRGV